MRSGNAAGYLLNNTINYYSKNAKQFQTQYDSVDAAEVHASWHQHLASLPVGYALDVGAGSGRDARWLAEQGWQVTAVEPAEQLRFLASKQQHPYIRWCDASLPHLANLPATPNHYSLILLSAVWMHLSKAQRQPALAALASNLDLQGTLVISLRFGPSDPKRPMFPVSIKEVQELAAQLNLKIVSSSSRNTDKLKRHDVHWETVLLQHME